MANLDGGDHSDPMNVRRRWGRRELVFLLFALVALVVVAVLARERLIGRPPHGEPVGYLPTTPYNNNTVASPRAP